MAVIAPSAVTVNESRVTRFSWPLGSPVSVKAAVRSGRQLQAGDFFFKLGVAEQKAKRRTQVVQLFCWNALHLASPLV